MRSLNKEPSIFVSAAVPYSLRQEIVALAQREDTTLSEEVRTALALLLQARAAEQSERNLAPTT